VRHLLVTNDFPPKVGGIQTYLWELWRRLDPNAVTVLATPHAGAADFDAADTLRCARLPESIVDPRGGDRSELERVDAEQRGPREQELPRRRGYRICVEYGELAAEECAELLQRDPVANSVPRQEREGAEDVGRDSGARIDKDLNRRALGGPLGEIAPPGFAVRQRLDHLADRNVGAAQVKLGRGELGESREAGGDFGLDRGERASGKHR